jgi:hypothetical protein
VLAVGWRREAATTGPRQRSRARFRSRSSRRVGRFAGPRGSQSLRRQQHEEAAAPLATDDGPGRRGAVEPPPFSPNERGRGAPFAQYGNPRCRSAALTLTLTKTTTTTTTLAVLARFKSNARTTAHGREGGLRPVRRGRGRQTRVALFSSQVLETVFDVVVKAIVDWDPVLLLPDMCPCFLQVLSENRYPYFSGISHVISDGKLL